MHQRFIARNEAIPDFGSLFSVLPMGRRSIVPHHFAANHDLYSNCTGGAYYRELSRYTRLMEIPRRPETAANPSLDRRYLYLMGRICTGNRIIHARTDTQ